MISRIILLISNKPIELRIWNPKLISHFNIYNSHLVKCYEVSLENVPWIENFEANKLAQNELCYKIPKKHVHEIIVIYKAISKYKVEIEVINEY